MKKYTFLDIRLIVLFFLFYTNSYSQKGKFELEGMNLTHPVTTFDRENTYSKIKESILNNLIEFETYRKIKNEANYYYGSAAYNSVNTNYSLEELQTKTQKCAYYARSQAFVALIGIDENNSFGNMDTIRKDFNFEKLLLNYLNI